MRASRRLTFVLSAVALLASVADLASSSSPPRRQVEVGDAIKVSVTAYCVEGETKSGVQTRRGIVAADPRLLPMGSVVRVDGLTGRHNRRYTVQDTGPAIKGRELDIFMPDCQAAKRFGRQEGRARVLRLGDAKSRS